MTVALGIVTAVTVVTHRGMQMPEFTNERAFREEIYPLPEEFSLAANKDDSISPFRGNNVSGKTLQQVVNIFEDVTAFLKGQPPPVLERRSVACQTRAFVFGLVH